MSLPDDDHDLLGLGPFESHAKLYMDRGWAPFPLPFRRKKWPPAGFTGDAGVDADADQIDVWLRTRRGSNIGLRIGALCVGIDVDNYDSKVGGATLADLEAKLGPLQPTWTTTSRDDGVSGIKYFRLPEARRLIAGLDGIEIIQRHHRYICAPPSIHPDTGLPYWWLDPDGTWTMDPPHVDDLPLLPDAWFEFLTYDEAAQSETRAKAKKADRIPGPINGNRSQAVDSAARYAIAELSNGPCRHDAMVAGAMALARLEESGHPGTDDAIADLRTEFITAIDGDRKDADQEFEKAIGSARHKAVTTAATRPPWGDLEHGRDIDLSFVSGDTLAPPRNVDPETGEKIGGTEPPPNVDDFFDARPELDRLRTFARSRRAAPWATTGVALVRCVSAVEPFVMLPPTIGGHASLNLFLGLVGVSGGGKGAAEAGGADAINFGDLTTWGVGSGEGIPHLFLRRTKAKDGEPAGIEQHTTRVLLRAPEVDTLDALKGRSGSTLLPKIRDAWIGDDLSFGYVDDTKRLPLRAHSYRLGLIVGIQPERAGVLLEHADDGTPQRFAWMPARDPHVPLVAPDEPEPWPAWRCPRWPTATNGRSVLGVCTEAIDAMDEAAVARHRGEVGALDGHSLLARLKVAAALGILNGRPEVNAEDWQLAGVFMAVSDHTRTATAETLAYKSTIANRARGQAEGEREIVRTSTVAEATSAAVARKLAAKIGPEWIGRSAIRRALNSADRSHFEDAADRLIAAGTIEVREVGQRGQISVQYRSIGGVG